MMTLELRSLIKGRPKCGICRENLFNFDALCVVENGRVVATYCDNHNEDDIIMMHPEVCEDDDGFAAMNAHERSMEDFGAYKAAGCTDAYWQDRDAGYAY